MKKLLLSSLFLYLLVFESLSQDTTARIDESFLKSVVHITIPQKQETGTGFLISCRSINRKYIITYLVTNKHMIGEYSLVDPFFLYDSIVVDFYSLKDDTPIPTTIKLSENGKRKNTVILYPDSRIDVAIINISNIFDGGEFRDYSNDTTYLQRLSSLKDIGFGFGSQVFAIGYPANIMIAETNEAIGKSGYIASSLSGKLKLRISMQDKFKKVYPTTVVGSFFIIDGLIIGGNSGSPIVVPKEFKTRIRNNEVQTSATPIPNLIIGIQSMSIDNTGLAIAYSSDNILDLVEQDLKNYPEFVPKKN